MLAQGVCSIIQALFSFIPSFSYTTTAKCTHLLVMASGEFILLLTGRLCSRSRPAVVRLCVDEYLAAACCLDVAGVVVALVVVVAAVEVVVT